MNTQITPIQFELPNQLACPEPTEKRGVERDAVRLLVTQDDEADVHTTFESFDQFLNPGDVIVVNTSATRAAAVPLDIDTDTQGRVHFSTPLGNNHWLIEIRRIERNRTVRWSDGRMGQEFSLPNGAKLTLKSQFYEDRSLLNLWVAQLETESLSNLDYLKQNALPIQYENLHTSYPLSYYNTYFSSQPGSSEMPSAARGFTQNVIDKLMDKGVVIVPILLHTGISSLEENERPYPEYMEINPVAASQINTAKKKGKRIVAIGTTAVRALESAVDSKGWVKPYAGMTELYIKSDHQVSVVTGLLTGFHEPKASHLHMLQSIAGYDHIKSAYQTAIQHQYYWHQFGDLHLIL